MTHEAVVDPATFPAGHGKLTRHPLVATLLVVVAVGILGGLLSVVLPGDAATYLGPMLASVLVFGIFWVILQRRLGENIFFELGFLYVALLMVHTLVPAFAFITASFFQGGPLDQLLPESTELRKHLWRQILFQVGFAAGYLVLRGRATWQAPAGFEGQDRDRRALVLIVVLLAVSVATVILMSAPVESYFDHYIRYDHLPWLQRKFVSLSIRMSLGLYCVLLVFLFRNYEKYKLLIPVVLAAICAHEIAYSSGARIQSLLVLLQAVCLYHFTVKRISLKAGVAACAVLAVFFSVMELVRLLDFDLGSARSAVAEEGLQPSLEFISVYFPGFHLYAERAAGTLPPREWPMFFSDVISLFTFGDFSRWNPMVWYARNYYPDTDIPPFTLGPIADSAIWGGEIDLVLRSVVNGLFFALIVRWFVRYGDRWWGLSVYVYSCATAILAVKYSVFLHLSLIEKNLLPVLLVVGAARVLRFTNKVPVSDGGVFSSVGGMR